MSDDQKPVDNAVIAPRPDLTVHGQVRIFTTDGQVGDYDLIMPWEQFVGIFLTQGAALVRSGAVNRSAVVKMFQIVPGAQAGGNVVSLHGTLN